MFYFFVVAWCIIFLPIALQNECCSSHLAYNAVLHVCFLVAALFPHKCDLQLAKGFWEDVTLGEELPPLSNVSFEQRRVILVTQYSLQMDKVRDDC